MKPDWMPDDLWSRVAPYLKADRQYDATRGFLKSVARHHPDFDEFAYRELSSAKKDALLVQLLGIKKRERKEDKESKGIER